MSRGKIKDSLVAYYTDTDKSQLNRNIQSSSVVDLKTEQSKRLKMSIWTSQSYEKKRTQGRIHASIAAKCHSTDFSFSYCNFLTIDKNKLQMRSFLHVELAYDVAMRHYIIHQSYTRTTHKTDHKILSGWMGYRQCFLWGW